MRCLDDCHYYEMETFFDKDPFVQGVKHPLIHFYEMSEDGTKTDGVTNEEVIRVLIHRLEALDKKVPCFENRQALTSLRGALNFLESRTEQRIKRGVEGTYKP